MLRQIGTCLIAWLLFLKLIGLSAVYAQEVEPANSAKVELAALIPGLLEDSSSFELTPLGDPGSNSNPTEPLPVKLEEKLPIEGGLPLIDSHSIEFIRRQADSAGAQAVQNKSGNDKQSNPVNTRLSINAAVMGLPSDHFNRIVSDSEIVGLSIVGGQSSRHVANTDDLDVAVTDEFERYLPLVRLLKGFHVRANREETRLTFQAEYSPVVVFDIAAGGIEVDGEFHQVDFIAGISDVTQKREIYLPADIIGQIFNFRMEWDDEEYKYVAHTENILSIWKRKAASSKGVELIPADLPQAHPPANPSTPLVSLVETRLSYRMSSGNNGEYPQANLNLSESIYGHIFGGRYLVSFSQPSLIYNEDGGLSTSETEMTLPKRIEWTRDGDSSQLFAGDTSFNLNDLAMPFISNMTGFRVSGLVGKEGDAEPASIPQFSLDRGFLKTNDYSGLARLGSEVKLIVNENEVAIAPVLDEPDAPSGYGRYEFFDVSIPGGSLVDIRIEITEPDGTLIELDKSSVRADRLVGDGQLAYLGGVGTKRNTLEWGAQGMLGGARLLYGVSPTLTLGITAAYQDEYFTSEDNNSDFRTVAKTSGHLATEFAWLAHKNILISGDLAMSVGDDTNAGASYDGTALRLRSDWYPVRNLDVSTQLYRYEPGFFDGQNEELEDRQGINISSRWRYKDWFSMQASLGQVEDNLDGSLEITRDLGYHSFEISSGLIPNSQLRFKTDRLTPDQGEEQVSYKVGAGYGNYGFSVRGEISESNGKLENEYATLLRGINATGVDLYPNQTKTLGVNKTLFGRHKVGLTWMKNEQSRGETYTLSHRWSGNSLFGLNKVLPLGDEQQQFDIFNEFRSELLQDSFTSRINIYLDNRRKSRLGLAAGYGTERGWSLTADLNLTNLFWMGDGIENISDQGIYPGTSAIKGKVFYDANGNTIMDPGEEGLSGIKVQSQGRTIGATDKNGNFMLTTRYGVTESSLYLDLESVPALLSPTHALQTAYLSKGSLTEINFGLAPLISLSGMLLGQEQDKKEHMPIYGARVMLFNRSGDLVEESITSSDGSYFLQAVPGNYSVKVDTNTVEGKYILAETSRTLTVTGQEEYQELDMSPIYAKLMSEGERSRLARSGGSAPDWGLDIPLLEESLGLSEPGQMDHFDSQLELIKDELDFDM